MAKKRIVGSACSINQRGSWDPNYQLPDIWLPLQAGSMWPWSKCQHHAQDNIWKIKLSCSFPYHDVCAAGRLYCTVSRGNRWKSIGMSQWYLHTCELCGSWHGRRSGNVSHIWGTILERCQCQNRCWNRKNKSPCWRSLSIHFIPCLTLILTWI